MVDLKYLAPAGIVRWSEYRERFRVLGLPTAWARSAIHRRALQNSQLELIPRSLLPLLDCVVDVGANLGEWSISIAQLTSARRIIAYEPVPAIFQQLRNNVRGYPQIECVQSAVGAQSGMLHLNVFRRHQLSSALALQDQARVVHGMDNDQAVSVQVPVLTLDESLAGQDEISLLKIDVQGYEPQVLDGARMTLNRTRVLMIEVTFTPYYHGDLQFGALNQLITSLAPLRLWGISTPHCAPSGKPMWADAVYVQASYD